MFNSTQALSTLFAATPDPWTGEFFGLDADQRFVILIIGLSCVTGIVCTVVGCASGVIVGIHRRRLDTDLKREFLDRGMSADEIARVVEATQPTDFLERWAASKKRSA